MKESEGRRRWSECRHSAGSARSFMERKRGRGTRGGEGRETRVYGSPAAAAGAAALDFQQIMPTTGDQASHGDEAESGWWLQQDCSRLREVQHLFYCSHRPYGAERHVPSTHRAQANRHQLAGMHSPINAAHVSATAFISRLTPAAAALALLVLIKHLSLTLSLSDRRPSVPRRLPQSVAQLRLLPLSFQLAPSLPLSLSPV